MIIGCYADPASHPPGLPRDAPASITSIVLKAGRVGEKQGRQNYPMGGGSRRVVYKRKGTQVHAWANSMAITKATEDAIKKAARALARGDIVAFPTETVYGLGANALNAPAVAKTSQRKSGRASIR